MAHRVYMRKWNEVCHGDLWVHLRTGTTTESNVCVSARARTLCYEWLSVCVSMVCLVVFFALPSWNCLCSLLGWSFTIHLFVVVILYIYRSTRRTHHVSKHETSEENARRVKFIINPWLIQVTKASSRSSWGTLFNQLLA